MEDCQTRENEELTYSARAIRKNPAQHRNLYFISFIELILIQLKLDIHKPILSLLVSINM